MRATSHRFTYFFLEMLIHGPDKKRAGMWLKSGQIYHWSYGGVDGPPGSMDQPGISPPQE
jgi:hypothetical protein